MKNKYVAPKFNATSIRQHYAANLLNLHFNNTGENLIGSGVKLCRRAKSFSSTNLDVAQIEVKQKPDGSITSNMHDVAHCGNAHLCAYCSAVKCKHLRDWLKEVHIPTVLNSGLVNGLLTLTAHHHRRSNWSTHTEKFFKALTLFRKTMRKHFKAIGCDGRVQATEYPIGANGMQLHIHDLFPYVEGSDLDSFKKIVLEKWQAALKTQGLWCSKKHGVDIQKHGKFDPYYIANEMSAHDTKQQGKEVDLDADEHEKGNNLFKLLDMYSKGDKHAGEDWLRVAKAMQGRDRFNVGQLANKLGIPSPSDWKKKEGEAKTEPANIIEYPQSQHLMATEPNSQRNGLAMILRTARQSLSNNMVTIKIVEALCNDYTKQRLLNAPIAAAKALERNTTIIEALLKANAISQEVAEDLIERAIVEVDLLQQLKVQEINTKLQVALTPQTHVKANAELDFS